MEIPVDCIGFAKSAVIMSDIILYMLRHDSRQGLNPKATNKKEIFLFYTLYIVGKNDYINSLPDLNNYLRKNISEGDIPITEETTNSYLQEMIGSNDYIDRIIDGANKIEEWPM